MNRADENAPTMAEQGFAEAQVTWFGVVVSKGMPQQVVEQISKTLEAALAKMVTEAGITADKGRGRAILARLSGSDTGIYCRPGQLCPVSRCFQHVPQPEIHRILRPDRSPAQPT